MCAQRAVPAVHSHHVRPLVWVHAAIVLLSPRAWISATATIQGAIVPLLLVLLVCAELRHLGTPHVLLTHVTCWTLLLLSYNSCTPSCNCGRNTRLLKCVEFQTCVCALQQPQQDLCSLQRHWLQQQHPTPVALASVLLCGCCSCLIEIYNCFIGSEVTLSVAWRLRHCCTSVPLLLAGSTVWALQAIPFLPIETFICVYKRSCVAFRGVRVPQAK